LNVLKEEFLTFVEPSFPWQVGEAFLKSLTSPETRDIQQVNASGYFQQENPGYAYPGPQP
jgi:hypothetical protein